MVLTFLLLGYFIIIEILEGFHNIRLVTIKFW